jgi:hypothetical protein
MWSLEKEIMTLTTAPSFAAALSAVGLLPGSEVAFSHHIISDWHRSGAETYTLIFEVRSGQNWKQKVVLKACVAYSTSITLQQILERWVARRHLLNELGVSTPTLFTWGYGLILEQYIEHELIETLQPLTGASKDGLVAQLIYLAACLDHEKFQPTSPFDDLRTDGKRVYVIDFGSDLGDPNTQVTEYYSLCKLQHFLGLSKSLSSVTDSSLYPLYREARARLSFNSARTKLN